MASYKQAHVEAGPGPLDRGASAIRRPAASPAKMYDSSQTRVVAVADVDDHRRDHRPPTRRTASAHGPPRDHDEASRPTLAACSTASGRWCIDHCIGNQPARADDSSTAQRTGRPRASIRHRRGRHVRVRRFPRYDHATVLRVTMSPSYLVLNATRSRRGRGMPLRVVKLGGSLLDMPQLVPRLRLVAGAPDARRHGAGGRRWRHGRLRFAARIACTGCGERGPLAVRPRHGDSGRDDAGSSAGGGTGCEPGGDSRSGSPPAPLDCRPESRGPKASPRMRLLVLDPWHFLREDEPRRSARPFPETWDVTSDSIAARLAELAGRRRAGAAQKRAAAGHDIRRDGRDRLRGSLLSAGGAALRAECGS